MHATLPKHEGPWSPYIQREPSSPHLQQNREPWSHLQQRREPWSHLQQHREPWSNVPTLPILSYYSDSLSTPSRHHFLESATSIADSCASLLPPKSLSPSPSTADYEQFIGRNQSIPGANEMEDAISAQSEPVLDTILAELSLKPRSRVTSSISSTSSIIPDPVVCKACNTRFNGEYRRGNLSRHQRQKHGVEDQVYRCEEPGCSKDFRRQDASLKHHRRCHPHLSSMPIVPRLR